MTPLLIALLASPFARCTPPECAAVVAAAHAAARPGVTARDLVAACLVESGCRPQAVGRPYTGRDLGAWQLHVTDHRPAIQAALASVAGLGAGATGAAWLLARSRRLCRRRRCVCWAAGYNWHARRAWCRRWRSAWRTLGGSDGANG